MKKFTLTAAALLFAVLMVLPVTASVNNTSGKLPAPNLTLCADGNPIPPFPPQGFESSTALPADGNPIPPFPPQVSTSTILAADGNPIPPFPPQITAKTLAV